MKKGDKKSAMKLANEHTRLVEERTRWKSKDNPTRRNVSRQTIKNSAETNISFWMEILVNMIFLVAKLDLVEKM